MIVLPAVGAIVAAVTPIIEAALIAAGVGAAVGGAACGISGVASGIHEHGTMNKEIAVESAHRAAECAVEGAVIGGATGAVGIVVAPVVAPALAAVDDVARPVIHVIDDMANSVVSTVDDAAASVGQAITAPFRVVQSGRNASIYNNLNPTACQSQCLYIMDDTATGLQKIGITNNPVRRIGEVSRDVQGNNLRYISIASLDDARTVESAMHRQFVNKNVTHPNHAQGREWFSNLSPLDLATIMGQ